MHWGAYIGMVGEVRCRGSFWKWSIGTKSGVFSQQSAGWPNGKALDYESRDCRFDPCVGHSFCFFFSSTGYIFAQCS